ncbi:phage tail protein I [Thermaerobacillus caldiproteolyticus]|uniref:phage tail protein I n=1 Tax=Thermaerobacillus caldiproteolyticus TaxID=247480 RepID=UPI00188B7556|nr:phage tail protein I [Anoxybacillus caldiproteolyticus]QPA33372.1 phage tail protein I [Anoxybacillus caldiproteolyticus]
MRNELLNIDLVALLPASLHNDEDTKAIMQAVSEEMQRLFQKCEEILSQDIPEFLLDLIAFERHVDFYSNDLPVEQKRKLINRSTFFHRQKGTPAAVEELITTVFGEGKVVEWFEYGGQPYHFKVVTSNRSVTQEKAEQFLQALNSVKNVRSVLEKIEITQSEDMNLYFAGVVHIGEKMTIRQVV